MKGCYQLEEDDKSLDKTIGQKKKIQDGHKTHKEETLDMVDDLNEQRIGKNNMNTCSDIDNIQNMKKRDNN